MRGTGSVAVQHSKVGRKGHRVHRKRQCNEEGGANCKVQTKLWLNDNQVLGARKGQRTRSAHQGESAVSQHFVQVLDGVEPDERNAKEANPFDTQRESQGHAQQKQPRKVLQRQRAVLAVDEHGEAKKNKGCPGEQHSIEQNEPPERNVGRIYSGGALATRKYNTFAPTKQDQRGGKHRRRNVAVHRKGSPKGEQDAQRRDERAKGAHRDIRDPLGVFLTHDIEYTNGRAPKPTSPLPNDHVPL